MVGVLKTPTFPSAIGKGIKRRPATIDAFRMDTVLADCDVLDISQLPGGAILLPPSCTGYTAHGCHTPSGTFNPINAADKTAGAITGANDEEWYELPSSAFWFSYIKIQAVTASGTGTLVSKT